MQIPMQISLANLTAGRKVPLAVLFTYVSSPEYLASGLDNTFLVGKEAGCRPRKKRLPQQDGDECRRGLGAAVTPIPIDLE